MKRTAAILAILATSTLTSCGGQQRTTNEPVASEEPPAPVSVTVSIQDARPLNHFTNADSIECSSRSFEEALDNAMGGSSNPETTPVTVTLRDADGTIVASEELPQRGGTFRGGSCTFDLTVDDVPASEFYEAEINGYNLSETMTSPAGEVIEFSI